MTTRTVVTAMLVLGTLWSPPVAARTEQEQERWTPSTGQLINVAKWNLLRYLPVKMRGAEDDQEETAQSFASV